jgi:hypothetical protein
LLHKLRPVTKIVATPSRTAPVSVPRYACDHWRDGYTVCPINSSTVGRSTPDMTRRLANVCRRSLNVKLGMTALRTARSNAVRKERYGTPLRLQKTAPVAIEVILTSSKIVVNTSFMGTLRLSPFLA